MAGRDSIRSNMEVIFWGGFFREVFMYGLYVLFLLDEEICVSLVSFLGFLRVRLGLQVRSVSWSVFQAVWMSVRIVLWMELRVWFTWRWRIPRLRMYGVRECGITPILRSYTGVWWCCRHFLLWRSK